MPRPRQTTSARYSAEVSTIGGATTVGDDSNRSTTLFIVIISLLFVAIFGGALVGGIVSGDPTNGFFITIIAASAVAISVALLVSIRYYSKNRASNNEEDHITKDVRGTFSGSDEDAPQEDEYYKERRERRHHHQRHNHRGRAQVEARIKEIQARSVAGEMSALSPHSYDVESLSSRTRKDIIGARSNMQQRRGLFDFSSIATEARSPPMQQVREDPPEGAGPATYHAAWIVRGQSQDPDAHKVNENGEIVSFDEEEDRDIEGDIDVGLNSFSQDHSIPSPQSTRSRYQVDGEEREIQQISEECSVVTDKDSVVPEPGDEKKRNVGTKHPNSAKSKGHSSSRSEHNHRSRQSRSTSRSTSRSRSSSRSPSKKSSKKKENNHKAQRPTTSTKSVAVASSTTVPSKTSTMGTSPAPSTPAGSDTGSFASSFFKPLNDLFGKKGSNKYLSSEAGQSEGSSSKYTTSEAGQSDVRSPYVKSSNSNTDHIRSKSKPKATSDVKSIISVGAKSEGKPPMMPDKKKRGFETIPRPSKSSPEERYEPSTPGNKSVYSIPPPRRVPSTPGGASVIFSEFRSVADSSAHSAGVASSTFDASAHDKALRKMQKMQASLGANTMGDDAMSVYYDDEDKASSVAASSVFPSNVTYDVFAPSGAIGIVVDTSAKGCVVHSLKKSSPMQGLMNPGDLIIALDDFDVRKMNAASLTKLMAKKSQQAERKFTLVPADYV